MSKNKRGRLALAAVSAGAAVSGVGLMAPTASATGPVNVDNTNNTCSDAAGSTLFCNIAPAITAAGPSGTVSVLNGTYAGPVTVTGAALNGLTLLGNGNAVINGGLNGFVIGNVSNVTVDGFKVQNTSDAGFLLGDHRGTATTRWVTDNLTIKNNSVTYAGNAAPGTAAAPAAGFDSDYLTNSTFTGNRADNNNDYGFYFVNGSNGNKILHNEASGNATPPKNGLPVRRANGINILTNGNTVDGNVVHDNQDSGIQIYRADHNVVTNNVVYHNGDHGIDNLNATNGSVLNNTAYDNCTAGINVEGTIALTFGYVVENNIAVDNGTDTTCAHGPVGLDHSGQGGQVRIGDNGILDATTTEDYNLVATVGPGVLVPAKNARQINNATTHDVQSVDLAFIDTLFVNPGAGDFHLQPASPAIGKADPNPILNFDPKDFNGNFRPTPGSIGAYEAGSTPTLPIAYAVVGGPVGFAPNAVVSIDASGSWAGTTPGGVTYSVDFDSANPNPANVIKSATGSHKYATPGTYDIAVTVTDTANHADTQHYKVTVTAKPATANLTVTPAAAPSLDVTASGANSVAGTNAIAKYDFDFGDSTPLVSTTAPTSTAAHTYAMAGTYTVLLTVTDSTGLSSTSSIPVTVGGGSMTVNQIGGKDRYATGLLVSQHRWQAGQANAVVLATGKNFADALAGVPLAAKAGGPLLLVDGSSGAVDPAVYAEITRVLKPGGQIYILGGTAAVSQGIETQLHGVYPVTRYQGENRYLTSLDIATRGLGSPKHAVVATGNGFADALASGPFATGPFADGPGAPAAILLSNDKTLDPHVAGYLANKDMANVATIGHQAATAVPAASHSYAGNDRFTTDQLVAGAFTGAAAGSQVGVADGMNFPDALTGGAYMASLATPGPVVLLDGVNKSVPQQAAAVLDGRRSNIEADLFGGPAVITTTMSSTVLAHLAASTVIHIGF